MSRAVSVVGLLVMVQVAVGQTAKLYWYETLDAGGTSIYRANLNGSEQELLFSGQAGLTPRGMDVDLISGKLFWAVSSRIHCANLDIPEGETALTRTDIEIVLETGNSNTQAFRLDRAARKMYWTEGSTRRILRADLNGSNVEVIVDRDAATGNIHKIALAPAGNVPAIGGIGLLVMVGGLIAAAGFVLRRRGAWSAG